MNILVLKLGALGNIVLSLAAFAAIRQHHPGARISLLTTAPYADWMAGAPWFDSVLVDNRPAWWDLPGVLRLRRMLRGGEFDRVYDLQTSSRSSHYFRLFPPGARPEWSGIAPGCSLPDRDPDRARIHDMDRQHGQLRQAGIADISAPDLSWCRGDIARFALPQPFALLVPGSAPHRPVKRWPAVQYRALASWLARRGVTPVVLGSAGERTLADEICAGATTQSAGARDLIGATTRPAGALDLNGVTAMPTDARDLTGATTMPTDARDLTGATAMPTFAHDLAGATTRPTFAPVLAGTSTGPNVAHDATGTRDLTGQTSFGDLADLGRSATIAIGNDTGPMHLLAAIGCPSLVLFSRASNPALCLPRAPPGAPCVRVLRRDDLATLTLAEVIAEVAALVSTGDTETTRTAPPISARATA
jgi:ADP-heptose:LPS heptosyltransferase